MKARLLDREVMHAVRNDQAWRVRHATRNVEPAPGIVGIDVFIHARLHGGENFKRLLRLTQAAAGRETHGHLHRLGRQSGGVV